MKRNLKKYAIGMVGIGISIVILYLLGRKIDIEKSIHILKSVPAYYYIGMMTIYLSGFFIRAFRWKLMVDQQDISFRKYLDSIVVGFAGNNLIPARGGEFVRMFFFSKKTQVNRLTTLSSIFIEKILDGLSLVFVLLISISLQQSLLKAIWLKQLTITVSFLFFGLLLTLIIVRIYQTSLLKWLSHKEFPLKPTVVGILEKVTQALNFINADRKSVLILGFSMLIWVVEGAMFPIGLKAIGLEGNLIYMGYFMLAIVNFGILVPSSPGYLGVFQAMSVLALVIFGAYEEMALSAGILIHLCQFLPITIWGGIILLSNGFRNMFPTEQGLPD